MMESISYDASNGSLWLVKDTPIPHLKDDHVLIKVWSGLVSPLIFTDPWTRVAKPLASLSAKAYHIKAVWLREPSYRPGYKSHACTGYVIHVLVNEGSSCWESTGWIYYKLQEVTHPLLVIQKY